MNTIQKIIIGASLVGILSGCAKNQNYNEKNYSGRGYDVCIKNHNTQMYGFDIKHKGSIDEAIISTNDYWPGLVNNIQGIVYLPKTMEGKEKWKHLITDAVTDSNEYFKTENTRLMTTQEQELLNDAYKLNLK